MKSRWLEFMLACLLVAGFVFNGCDKEDDDNQIVGPEDVLSWTQTFGGTDVDAGYSVQQTTDGGYVIVGTTRSFGAGGRDVWMIKTDSNGDTLWTQTFGGTDYDHGLCIQQTIDGGYIITGLTQSFSTGDFEAWLIKTDSDGNEVWWQTFAGAYNNAGKSVQQTAEGGYIIAGDTKSIGTNDYNIWLIKTDSAGNELWSQTFGGTRHDKGYSVQQTTDGGYIITGSTESFGAGGGDAWLIKTDSDGNEMWNQTYGGTEYENG
ncbi:MAG TPA: hypothetical protein ENH10_04750 [Bacteroidetes bacterium]|nr:hypothetical protein [Bacteroidota bacterium]HEX04450.1 hypothetical protein [Bacteroidota bacterium]